MRKFIVVDEIFLKRKYKGVLLLVMAQDAECHIILMDFCVANKECDTSYQYFFKQMRNYVDDIVELCIIFGSHPSIRKMVSIIYASAYYGCYMRHLGKNIRNNYHNSNVMSHIYKAAEVYNRVEFFDHFNQIRDMVPKAAKHLKRVGFYRQRQAFCLRNMYVIINLMFYLGLL